MYQIGMRCRCDADVMQDDMSFYSIDMHILTTTLTDLHRMHRIKKEKLGV